MPYSLSFDDGHPQDLKIAELLNRRNIRATFFVPAKNVEGRPTLSANEIREIVQGGHIIGSHTYNHIYLSKLSSAQAKDEIESGKKYLEDILGQEVATFCFPGGKYSQRDISILKEAGVRGARTTKNFHTVGRASFIVNTAFQFFPHSHRVLYQNYLQYGQKDRVGYDIFRWRLSANPALINNHASWPAVSINDRHHLHIWAHSWEICETNLWDRFLAFLSGINTQLSNTDLF